MNGFLITILAVIASAAVTWWICSSRNSSARTTRTGRPAVHRPTTGQMETGPMVYFADDRHGSRDREYRFNYKKVNGTWRAYILRMPDLRGRNASGLVTHRLFDGTKAYIC